jgi:hypothetical protein
LENLMAANDVGNPTKSPAELALQIYNILVDQESDVRRRVMHSAMTLLGETALSPTAKPSAQQAEVGFDDVRLGPKAMRWIQKHAVTREMLEELYHLSDEAMDIIASSVPGATKREMAINCYLLSGIRGLLKSDAPTLDEAETIAVCKRLTAYDKNNHTTNRQAVGNKMSGSRPTFTLTGPGETAAAELIKQMVVPKAA